MCLQLPSFGAADRGITIEHARVVADGGFNEDGTESTGVRLDIEVIADAPQDEIKSLIDYAVDDSAVAHILTHPTTVQLGRVEARGTLNPILRAAGPQAE